MLYIQYNSKTKETKRRKREIKMEVTRVLESAWFHNLNKIMTAFIKNPKASLTDCYKHAAKNPSIEAGEGLKIHFYYSINTLTFELLALTTEIFQKDGINFADPKINKLIKELKDIWIYGKRLLIFPQFK